MSMMPMWAVLRASSSCFSSSSIFSSSSLIASACGTVIASWPVNSYLAASSSTWYLSPSRSITPTSAQAHGDWSSPAAYQSRSRSRICSVLHRLVKTLAKLLGHLGFAGLIGERLLGPLADGLRFVAGQNLSLPLLEHRDQRVDARAEAGDLAGIEPNRAGQLLFGQLAVLAEHEHVLERRRHQIGRRLRRAGKPRRIVPLVRVDDAAECVAIGHEKSRAEGRELRARAIRSYKCWRIIRCGAIQNSTNVPGFKACFGSGWASSKTRI